ncbi:MAG TPA: F0F1 ATP synthase subunit delta, partial [Acidimicrobiales bacterium]|nr:F0F1 ATP synthase subunit delta [Acidimicrobiales bacterium]
VGALVGSLMVGNVFFVIIPNQRKVVRDLLAGRARPQTVALAAYAVGAGRPRDPVAALSWMAEQVAAERNLRVAQVRSARPLDPDQQRRLAGALSRRVDRPVELRVTLDPSLIGGVVVLVGDIVVDASLRRRLDQLRQALSEASYTGASERG